MKRFVSTFCFLVIGILSCLAQMDIKVQLATDPFDSVKIESYNHDKKHKISYSQPYSNEVSFKDKQSLPAGFYWIIGDTSKVGSFLISNNKNQKFTVIINNDTVIYQGSEENTNNVKYISRIQSYGMQMRALDAEFQQAQSSLPQYMLRVLADSLTAKAKRINKEQDDYQLAVIKENQGHLLSSIVQLARSLPEMPQEYYQNRELYQQFVVEHFFDNFPWNDPRIFETPIADDKIKEYCNIIYQLDRKDLDTFVVATLNAARVNEQSLYRFYDKLEKILGSNISPYKVEHTYIKMLQNILSYPKLDEDRQRRCSRELKTINKNLEGDLVPNFRIVMANGDTTSLYDIQSNYMLLYLQHPTCPTCREVRGKMANFPALNTAIAKGKIKVLTVYFEDDEQVWKNYLKSSEANPSYLHGWNFDQTIEDNELYDTRTIPFMFLLDKDKKVIRKDLLYNEIEDYIKKLGLD